MKKFNLLLSLLMLFFLLGCGESITTDQKGTDGVLSNLSEFESSYVKQYLSDKTQDVKLLGYKTMPLVGEARDKFKEIYNLYKEEINNERGIFIAKDFSFYRVYFPMHTAIVTIDGKELTANENGVVALPAGTRAASDNLDIVARVKSDKVTGCGTNIILDTRIVMKDKIVPKRFSNNTYVFDMGNIGCCMTRGGVSCTQNHGSYANCSYAFDIFGDNCTTRSDVCMDYNGFGSDCVKGPKTYFIGSDCFKAMALGHCWNEIMGDDDE